MALFAAALAGCAGERLHREGQTLIADGKVDEGLAKLEQAVKEEPTNAMFRSDFYTRRADYVNRLLNAAQSQRGAGKPDDAEASYQRVLSIEPGNSRAQSGLQNVARDRRHAPMIDQATEALKKGEAERALAFLKPVATENPSNPELIALKRQIDEQLMKQQVIEPTLNAAQGKINLEFRDANLKMVFEALARTAGVNFILDKDVRPDLRTTIFLKQATLEDAVELLLQTNQLEKKVLNRNTVLIYPNTPEKQKEYQELVVKSFYLTNADAKQIQGVLKALLKSKDVTIDERLNLVVMRDTPDAIRLAEKIIAMHDLFEPEVMLEVEVLEVQRSRLLDLGIQFPNQVVLTPLGSSASASSGSGATSSTSSSSLTLSDLKHLNSDRIGVSLPNMIVNLRREVSDANILANPRIRVRNREKAKIMIGDKVPVVTTTSTATGFVGESIQYLDVGLKLEVEPNIYLQDDVAIKVALEVSSLVKEVKTPSGGLAYQIGSRSANTVLRLKDGETQVLAGLISDEDRSTSSRVPGLGDLPILGRLFSSQKEDRLKTEIVLSITPHLIRNINRPDAAAGEFWSGTESLLRTRPLTLRGPRGAEQRSAEGTPDKGGSPEAPAGPATDDRPANADPSFIKLTWQGPNQVKVGDQFKVALRVNTDGGLRSLPFQASFDASALQLLEVSEGGFFKQNEAKTNFSSNIDQAGGKVFVGVSRSGIDGARGEESVVVLTFRATAAKPQADIKLLTTTPIIVGEKNVTPNLPAPLSVTIAN